MIITDLLFDYFKFRKAKIPFKIPNYILPEIFQWANDNSCIDALSMRIFEDTKEKLFSEVFMKFFKVSFIIDIQGADSLNKFEKFLYDNRYNFLWKKFKFYIKWIFYWKTDDNFYISHCFAELELFDKILDRFLKINNLIGPDNWCVGEFGNVSKFPTLFGNNTVAYLNFLYFFGKGNRNLYKLADI